MLYAENSSVNKYFMTMKLIIYINGVRLLMATREKLIMYMTVRQRELVTKLCPLVVPP